MCRSRQKAVDHQFFRDTVKSCEPLIVFVGWPPVENRPALGLELYDGAMKIFIAIKQFPQPVDILQGNETIISPHLTDIRLHIECAGVQCNEGCIGISTFCNYTLQNDCNGDPKREFVIFSSSEHRGPKEIN